MADWSVRWWLDLCVCAWGTNPNRPFPDWQAGQNSYTLYEPNQFVLGTGTWLEGPASPPLRRPCPLVASAMSVVVIPLLAAT